jgi:hypothetical protein
VAAAVPSLANGVTTTYMIDTMLTLKKEMRIKAEKTRKARKKDKLRLQQMERYMQEMERRVQEQQEDNARLRSELVAHMAVHHTVMTPPMSSFSHSSARVPWGYWSTSGMIGANGEAEWDDGVQLREEMLWHLPFLRHFNLAPSELVIRDLRLAQTFHLVMNAFGCAAHLPSLTSPCPTLYTGHRSQCS